MRLLLRPSLPALLLIPLLAQPTSSDLASFEHVWTTVRDKHWDPAALEQPGGFSWQRVHDELLPRVKSAKNSSEARGIIREMVSRLPFSHYQILGGEVYDELDAPGGDGQPGIDVAVISNHAFVCRLDPKTQAPLQVRLGWRILRIDGRPVDPVLTRIAQSEKPHRVASTQRGFLLSRLSGPVGSSARVDFLDGAGRPVTAQILRAAPQGAMTRFGFLPPIPVWIETRQIPVAGAAAPAGYVRFNLFLDPARIMPAIEKAVRDCANCSGFVVDLRGNPGGLGVLAMGLAGFFINEPDTALGKMIRRDTTLNFIINPRPPVFRGPLAVLIDGGTGSTSEIFAGGVKDLGRARIFGTRSMGAALPSIIERLPNGDGFQYAVANYISKGGKPLEGDGVEPHQTVEPTQAALLAGRDLPLQAALEWIHAQTRSPSPPRNVPARSPR
jgi:carboxyl-terminal processing protease